MNKSSFTWVDAAIIILFLLSVYFILTRIFGHSAADLTITVTLFSLLGGLLYKLNREFGEFRVKAINSFGKMKEDIKGVKVEIIGVKSDMNGVRGDMRRVREDINQIKKRVTKK